MSYAVPGAPPARHGRRVRRWRPAGPPVPQPPPPRAVRPARGRTARPRIAACDHRELQVQAFTRWAWHVRVVCHACRGAWERPGRWWRRRDVAPHVERTLAMVANGWRPERD